MTPGNNKHQAEAHSSVNTNLSRYSAITGLLFVLCIFLLSCSPVKPLVQLPDFDEITQIITPQPSPPPSTSLLKKRHPDKSSFDKQVQQGLINYNTDVKPILESRCVVCHACYDAPCQLKLTAPQGIERGASKLLVHDGRRILPAQPTRLFIDALSVSEWRTKQFIPIIDEQSGKPEAALKDSLLYQLIKLKADNPLPTNQPLTDKIKFESYRSLSCPTLEEFPAYKAAHPQWGMPYGLPGLNHEEYNTLTEWLKQGAIFPPEKKLANSIQKQINHWETFLNGNDLKSQLIARYLYEHLAFAHLYFGPKNKGVSMPGQIKTPPFFSLIRSSTPPGKTIKLIATARPYDSPGVTRVYYRFQAEQETIVNKSHLPYALNQEKMQRLKNLFFSPRYSVTSLPGYSVKAAANPFTTFASIPAQARYQFMLDDAYFFISAFIKGPVCWGPIALNVINDRFFVVFTNPELDPVSNNTAFLNKASHTLSLPAEMEDNFKLAANWTHYAKKQQKYLAQKRDLLEKEHFNYDLNSLWTGNGPDGDGALTIFRHFNSASVEKGFIGDTPKTTWVLDYPLFERIYYLLVAGFNVYGNVGHQLSTRLYMDFLRMEGESNFVNFLPADERIQEHHRWYKNIRPDLENFLFNTKQNLMYRNGIQLSSTKPKNELLQKIAKHTETSGQLLNIQPYWLPFHDSLEAYQTQIELKLLKLSHIKGKDTSFIPDLTFIHIVTDKHSEDLAYTLVRNKAHSSVDFIFGEDLRRVIEQDTLTLLRGFTGSYPNYIYRVEHEELDEFITAFGSLENEKSLRNFNQKWGLQRNNPNFWKELDWIQLKARKLQAVHAGLFDLNRYLNQ